MPDFSGAINKAIAVNLCMFILAPQIVGLASEISQTKGKKSIAEKTLSVAESIERVKPGIVQIRAIVNTPSLNPIRHSSVLGTGFIVSKDGHVITANHVVSVSLITVASRNTDRTIAPTQVPIDPTMMRIAVAMPEITIPQISLHNSFNVFEFDIVEQDARHDIALLKFRRNPFDVKFLGTIKTDEKVLNTASKVIALKLAKTKPKDGEQVAISGYPVVAKTLITTVGHIASTGEIEDAEISIPSPYPNIPGFIREFNSMNLFLVDITANPGNSGGPVFSANTGEVIGTCHGGKIINNYYAGLAIVIPIKYAIDLLLKHKVPL